MQKNTPKAGDLVQDRIGHWYRVLEVRAQGWQLLVDAHYETPKGFYSYGYRPVLMGRSEFKFSRED